MDGDVGGNACSCRRIVAQTMWSDHAVDLRERDYKRANHRQILFASGGQPLLSFHFGRRQAFANRPVREVDQLTLALIAGTAV
jgi:hypothetical protein